MELDDICPIVDSITDLPHYDKRGVLHDFAHRAAHSLSIDEAIVFNALLKREEFGSTGVGHGVAIPHVRNESWDCAQRIVAYRTVANNRRICPASDTCILLWVR
jgi:mannitol/fructose-specific phosphotransferase system IIA component (Ntr-type)